jgi:hypothetical protein
VGHLGTEFGIIVNNPQLREGFIAQAERSERHKLAQRAARSARGSVGLRVRLADALHALAMRIAPPTPHSSEPAPASPTQPVFAD